MELERTLDREDGKMKDMDQLYIDGANDIYKEMIEGKDQHTDSPENKLIKNDDTSAGFLTPAKHSDFDSPEPSQFINSSLSLRMKQPSLILNTSHVFSQL